MLEAPWWTGVAGITQIVAAVLSIIAVRQASLMMKQADQSRLEAMSPAWEFIGSEPTTNPGQGRFVLQNTGLGAARNSTVTFQPSNGVTLNHLSASGARGHGKIVLPGDNLSVNLILDSMQHVDGVLVVASDTRAGKHASRFRLRTYFSSNELLRCELEPLP